ncbi:hypothetical protein FOZ60_009564, partial [Perkinsus olseni]
MARLPRIARLMSRLRCGVSLVSNRSPLGEVLGGSSGSIGHRQKVEDVDLESSAHVCGLSVKVTWLLPGALWQEAHLEGLRGTRGFGQLACSLPIIATDCSGRCHAALFLNSSYSIEAFPLTSNADEALRESPTRIRLLLPGWTSPRSPLNLQRFTGVRGYYLTPGLSWPVISDPKKLRDLSKALATLDIDVDAFMRIYSKGSSVRLVRDICQASADEQVGQDWLDAAKESVE